MKELSPNQKALLAYAGEEILHRTRGGCWAKQGEPKDPQGFPVQCYGTPTVRALIKTGHLRVMSEAPWGPVAVKKEDKP